MTAHAGVKRRVSNVADPATGEDVLPPSHPHSIHHSMAAARAAGLHADVVLEHEGTPRLVERTPRARKYLGEPMLVAFRFTSALDGDKRVRP